jgi:hypothetical protein
MHSGDPDRLRRRVGVFPPASYQRARRLLDALEQAFDVRFEPRAENEWADLDALVCIGARGRSEGEGAAAAGVRALTMLHAEAEAPGPVHDLRTEPSAALDRRLRGRTLTDAHVGTVPSMHQHRGEVLATIAGKPFWTRDGLLDVAAAAPAELAPHERLRDRMQRERFAALLPLVHLLRELTAATRWQAPAPRAAFLLDDPNLHWPSYGFLRLPDLVRRAETHAYHLALAMIPLDAWFAHPRALKLLRRPAGALSLLVHGNNHVRHELGRPASEEEGVAVAAQALRRVCRFERRSGVRIARVMVPPHEACSEATVRGLLLSGFDAITMTRPYPWLSAPADPWLAGPDGAGPLTGWERVDFVAGGMPVLLRHPIVGRDATEMALRAYLDQPLVLYGHHADLADGLDLLEETAAEVNSLTAPRWCSLDEIAASSFETRHEGEVLRVRMLTRRARVDVPQDVSAVSVALPAAHGARGQERLRVDGALHGPLDGEPTPVVPGATLDLRLEHVGAIDPQAVPAPRLGPLALARRVVGEGRDRVQPFLGRAR